MGEIPIIRDTEGAICLGRQPAEKLSGKRTIRGRISGESLF